MSCKPLVVFSKGRLSSVVTYPQRRKTTDRHNGAEKETLTLNCRFCTTKAYKRGGNKLHGGGGESAQIGRSRERKEFGRG